MTIVNEPEIAMCWDGQSEAAELSVDGMALTGKPADVKEVFESICYMKETLAEYRDKLEFFHSSLLATLNSAERWKWK